MNFALVNGIKEMAKPKILGLCPFCNAEVISKCGKIKIWHWAHKGKLACDPWWENETEWHRNWKAHFPKEWQEVIHYADNGEKHIADVRTEQNWIIEFQHSPIKPEEQFARNSFYKKIVWIVDGKRRLKDYQQFLEALKNGKQISANPKVFSVSSIDCKLFAEWSGSNRPIFFDFGEEDTIWLLHPKCSNGRNYILAFSRKYFLELHLGNEVQNQNFVIVLNNFSNFIKTYIISTQTQVRRQLRFPGLIFRRHLARRRF